MRTCGASVELEGVVEGGILMGYRGFIRNWLEEKLAALDDDLHKHANTLSVLLTSQFAVLLKGQRS